MTEFTTPLPSGLRVRDIQVTRTLVDGKEVVTPVLDENGHEIEISAVDVPLHIEAAEGTAEERKQIIEGYVADVQSKGPELALVRANAMIEGEDPASAETKFVATQVTSFGAADSTIDVTFAPKSAAE